MTEWSRLLVHIKLAICACGLCLALGACTTFPGLEAGARLPPSTEPVVLLPLDELVAQAKGGVADDTTAADLAASAARLRARAAAVP